MQTEHGIAENFEHYDDAKEFRRLVRAVKFSKKHFLYFVCCNQVPKQNELIADVEKSLAGKKIKVIKFKKPITDLLSELQKRKFDAECEAVFVQGLEYSISSDGKGSENALIYNLNISRDSFKKYFSCPLFLWIPEYALIKITRHAPDFFSVRSGTFYFSSTAEKVTEQIFQNFTSGWLEVSSLPITQKLKKIETLESLLSEYQALHREKRNKQTEGRLLSELADLFDFISENRKAIDYHKQALMISREIDNRLVESSILSSLGIAYDKLGEYKKAIDYYEQSLVIKRKVGDRSGEANSLNNLGISYRKLGEYRKAIDNYEKALNIFLEINNRSGEAKSLGNLGNVYVNLGKYRKAIDYHEQFLSISRGIGDRSSEAKSLGNLGTAYDNLGEYRKAIDYYKQSLAIFREIGDRSDEGSSLFNLAGAYNSLGERAEACSLWKEAVAIFEAIESPSANVVRQKIEEHCH